jgi:transposase
MTYLVCPDTPAVNEYATVHIAWELSKADWKLGVIVPGAKTMSRYAIKGGSLRSAPRRARPACR